MRIHLTLMSFLTCLIVYSQTEDHKKKLFKDQLKVISSEYKIEGDSIKIIHSDLLNERLTKAFNQVVFSSSDLVDNASAFGISQNKEKTTVSVNTNFHLGGKNEDQWYLKGGINASGSGAIFDLYSSQEWRNSVGLNLGVIWKFYGSGITNEETTKFEHDKVLRKVFIRDSIMNDLIGFKKEDYKKEREAYIKALEEEDLDKIDKKNIEKHYKNLKAIEVFFKKIEKYKTKNKDEKLYFNKYNDSINKLNDKIIDEIIDIYWSDDGKEALSEIIEDIAYEYDKKNIKNTGYSFSWIDINANLNNNTYNFSEKAENVNSEILSDFNALDIEKTGINKLSTVLSVNINYSCNNAFSGLWYLKGGIIFNSGSFLNSNLINGTAKVNRVDENSPFFIEDDNRILGDFNSIENDFQYGAFDLYGVYFFGKKKVIGLNLAYSHKFSIKTPKNSFYKKNYSILLGPIFRKPKEDDDTGLTFGIDIGFENSLYDARANDNFVARIRVGIPFKLYNINK